MAPHGEFGFHRYRIILAYFAAKVGFFLHSQPHLVDWKPSVFFSSECPLFAKCNSRNFGDYLWAFRIFEIFRAFLLFETWYIHPASGATHWVWVWSQSGHWLTLQSKIGQIHFSAFMATRIYRARRFGTQTYIVCVLPTTDFRHGLRILALLVAKNTRKRSSAGLPSGSFSGLFLHFFRYRF